MIRTAALALALLASPAFAGKKKSEDAAPPAPPAPPAAPAAPAAEAAPAGAPTPADIYEYRHQAFEALGKHMKASSLMAKGRAPARQADMVAHAQAMQGLSTYLLEMFPAGTGPDVVPDSEALAEVWTDWAGFQAKAQDFATESQALVTTAQGGDVAAFGAQLGKVGATCGACHDGYRKGD